MITHSLLFNWNVDEAHKLISEFLTQDVHYLDSSEVYGAPSDLSEAKEKIRAALELFVKYPENGGAWLTLVNGEYVAVCIFSFAISTSVGDWVVKMDDVYVKEGYRGKGIGQKHIDSLKAHLKNVGIKRIDTSVHMDNADAKRFYQKAGFAPLTEEKLSCLL